MCFDPCAVGRPVERLGHDRGEFLFHLSRRIRLEDARVRLDHLGERPVRDALPVGQAPALSPVDELGLAFQHAEELGHQPALADARNSDERDELGRLLLARPLERVSEEVHLLLPSDERRSARPDVDAEARAGLDRLPDADRLRLALRRNSLTRLVRDRLLRRPIRRLVHQDPVHRSRRLKTRRRVHHIARSHPLTLHRTSAERDQRLPGRHRYSNLKLTLLPDPVTNRKRRPNRPLRIVLMRRRRAEQRHHRRR